MMTHLLPLQLNITFGIMMMGTSITTMIKTPTAMITIKNMIIISLRLGYWRVSAWILHGSYHNAFKWTQLRNSHEQNTLTLIWGSIFCMCNRALTNEGRHCIWIDLSHGANMGPTWVLSAPDGPHVGPMNLAIRDSLLHMYTLVLQNLTLLICYCPDSG